MLRGESAAERLARIVAVQRRALLSATAVGGSVYVLSAGCLDTRFKKVRDDLEACQMSFRAYGQPRKNTSS